MEGNCCGLVVLSRKILLKRLSKTVKNLKTFSQDKRDLRAEIWEMPNMMVCRPSDLGVSVNINPLKKKRRLLYLKTQFVPRSKHFSSRL